MKKLLLFLCIIITYGAAAQSGLQDVLYLKNGSIIRGMIIEHEINKSIKIKTADGSVFVYQSSDVDRITKEARTGKTTVPKKGYLFAFEAGYHPGIGTIDIPDNFYQDPKNDDAAIAIHVINGFRFNEYVSIAAGAGFYKYKEFEVIPLFGDLRFYLSPQSTACPYFSFMAGTALPTVRTENYGNPYNSIQVKNKPGTIINPNIGFRVGSGHPAFTFSVGYLFHTIKYEFSGITNTYMGTVAVNEKMSLKANFLTMRVGLMVN